MYRQANDIFYFNKYTKVIIVSIFWLLKKGCENYYLIFYEVSFVNRLAINVYKYN